jgi:hypothetical protein
VLRRTALWSSLTAFVAPLAFAIARVAASGGGGYSTDFPAVGFVVAIFAVGGAASLLSRVQGGRRTAPICFLAGALGLVYIGVAASLRG